MPINVGEVNASLRFTIQQQELLEAKAKLKELTQEFLNMGNAGDYAKERTLGMMNVAQQRVDSLRMSVAATKIELAELEKSSGLSKVEKDAERAGQKMADLERMSMRMIERMAIMYAFKETLSLIKDVYESAQAMETLNNRTDVSFGKLQQLQQLGDSVGITFKQTAGWIEKLQTHLEDFKGGDELKQLGLSFEQLFKMNPDERINAIAASLNNIASRAERGRIETKLFGSDAIDPLIPLLARMGGEIDKVNQMSDNTVRVLAEASRAYGVFGGEVQRVVGHILELGIKGAELIASPFFIMIQEGIPGLVTAAKNSELFHNKLGAAVSLLKDGPVGLLEFALGLDHIADSARKTSKEFDKPIMGQAFIDDLRKSIPLTLDQKFALDQLNSMHELTYANAVRATAGNQISTAQYKAYVEALAEAKRAQAEHNIELRKSQTEYDHAVKVVREILDAQSNWHLTLKTISPTLRAHVEELHRAGVSMSTLGEFYNLSHTQMNALTKDMQEQDAVRSREIKNIQAEEVAREKAAQHHLTVIELETKVDAKYHEILDDRNATSLDKKINAYKREYEDAVATALKKGILDDEYYRKLDRLLITQKKSAQDALSDASQFSRQHYQQEYTKAKEFYDSLLANATDHTQKEIDDARKKMEEKKKIYDNWRQHAEAQFGAVDSAAATFMRNFSVNFDHVMDDGTIKVQVVTGEVLTLAEAIARYTKVAGVVTYDLSTEKGVEHYRKLNPGATITLSDAQIVAMAAAGATVESLIASGYIDPYAGIRNSLHQTRATPMQPSGPLPPAGATAHTARTPLADGTFANPSAASAPSQVNNVTNYFYVNGSALEVYQQIKDLLMRDLKSSRMLGTN